MRPKWVWLPFPRPGVFFVGWLILLVALQGVWSFVLSLVSFRLQCMFLSFSVVIIRVLMSALSSLLLKDVLTLAILYSYDFCTPQCLCNYSTSSSNLIHRLTSNSYWKCFICLSESWYSYHRFCLAVLERIHLLFIYSLWISLFICYWFTVCGSLLDQISYNYMLPFEDIPDDLVPLTAHLKELLNCATSQMVRNIENHQSFAVTEDIYVC